MPLSTTARWPTFVAFSDSTSRGSRTRSGRPSRPSGSHRESQSAPERLSRDGGPRHEQAPERHGPDREPTDEDGVVLGHGQQPDEDDLARADRDGTEHEAPEAAPRQADPGNDEDDPVGRHPGRDPDAARRRAGRAVRRTRDGSEELEPDERARHPDDEE